MMSLEEQAESELVALYDRAGLGIVLRTLVRWAQEKFTAPGIAPPWWLDTTMKLLVSAQTIYEKRHLMDEADA